MTWRAPVLVLTAALSAPACMDTLFYTELVPPPRALSPRPPDQIAVFVVTPPAQPHSNLGLFQVIRGTNDHTVNDMIAELRQRAAGIGCEALLVTSIDHRNIQDRQTSIQASCIIFDDPGRRPVSDAVSTVAPAPQPVRTTAETTAPRTALITARPGDVHTAPFEVAPLVIRLQPGEHVSVSGDASVGWRVVRLNDGRVGYIEESSIRLE